METSLKKTSINSAFNADLDHLDALGTQIQWKNIKDAEAGTVLLLPETEGPPIHLHPSQEEEFFIRQGELMVYREDRWIKLLAGDTLTIPPQTAHTYKNVSKEKVVFDFYLTPDGDFRKMLEEIDYYVQQRKITGKNFTSITYLCRVMNKFPQVTQSVKPPQPIVKLMSFISRFL